MLTIITILVISAISFVAIRHLQRGIFYPHPARLPDNVPGTVDESLQRLEAALAAHAPDVLAALQPGLSDEQIAAAESRFGFRLTADMRALYKWRNGSPSDAQIEFIPGHSFLPLEQAARLRAERQRQLTAAPLEQRVAYAIFAGHRTSWIPVLDDQCGGGYFYDPRRRRRPGSFFYHFAEDRQYRFFPSLGNFLIGASECYESGIYRARRRGSAAEDFKRSFPLWQQCSEWRRS